MSRQQLSQDDKNKFYRGITNERHYCEACNAWMGGDRQSILLHENGKKHKLNVERILREKRQGKLQQEQNQKLLQSTLEKITAAALQKQRQYDNINNTTTTVADAVCSIASGSGGASNNNYYYGRQQQQQQQQQQQNQNQQQATATSSTHNSVKKEKQEWEELKRKRILEDQKQEEDGDVVDRLTNNKRSKITTIPLDQGHYTTDGGDDGPITYLEGPTFGEIFEEDMPVQLWTGPVLASLEEKRLPERHGYWKNGLIVTIQRKRKKDEDVTAASSQVSSICDIKSVSVAYLQSPDDEEETIEKSVALDRIRILLGSDYESGIPNTLEEARILAVGGVVVEEEQPPPPDKEEKKAELDDMTGLSTWSTVSIKTTTVQQQLKEERERIRQKERERKRQAELDRKKAEAQKMEEAKVENADDSALGAYDIWSRGEKVGYKGVSISTSKEQEELSVYDTAKQLTNYNVTDDSEEAQGKKASATITFKKKKSLFGNKNKKRKQNRRTTSADDL